MRRVGTTRAGTVLVEMTEEEWLTAKPTWDEAYKTAARSLYQWSHDFCEGLEELGLSTRPLGALKRAARVDHLKYDWETEKLITVEPYIRSQETFTDGPKGAPLLEFGEWCRWILTRGGGLALIETRGIGWKGWEEIREAALEFWLKSEEGGA